jgi:hypothetical protein
MFKRFCFDDLDLRYLNLFSISDLEFGISSGDCHASPAMTGKKAAMHPFLPLRGVV